MFLMFSMDGFTVEIENMSGSPCHKGFLNGILCVLWRDVREVEGESLETESDMW